MKRFASVNIAERCADAPTEVKGDWKTLIDLQPHIAQTALIATCLNCG